MRNAFIFTSLLALTATQANAADSAEVSISGVIRPSACTPAFASGGKIDYGTIPASSLSASEVTPLPTQTIGYSITCDGPTRAGYSIKNNRPGTVDAGVLPGDQSYVFGMTRSEGKTVGGYFLHSNGLTLIDGRSDLYVLTRPDSASSWSKANYSGLSSNPGVEYAFAETADSSTPMAFTLVSGNFDVHAYINRTSQLNVSNEINLDGSFTMQVVYH